MGFQTSAWWRAGRLQPKSLASVSGKAWGRYPGHKELRNKLVSNGEIDMTEDLGQHFSVEQVY